MGQAPKKDTYKVLRSRREPRDYLNGLFYLRAPWGSTEWRGSCGCMFRLSTQFSGDYDCLGIGCF